MADAAVRTANPDDAGEIARIQLGTWRAVYRDLLGEQVLAGLDLAEATRAWHRALTQGEATVYLATEGQWTVGFCVAGPAPETEIADAHGDLPADAATTGLVGTLLVEPRWGRRGHGGRLLVAAAEGLRARGSTRGVCWVPESDDVSLRFYSRVGWESDGTVRTLDAGGRPLREVRLTGGLDLYVH